MHNPDFSLSRFGAFDSPVVKAGEVIGKERVIAAYEFEFYTQDSQGGLKNDGVFYPSRKGGCTLAKPGQVQQTVRPNRGYFMNVVTQDPELCDMLDHLPNFFILWNMSAVVKLINEMIAMEEQDSLVGRMQLHSCACRILALLSQYRQDPKKADSGVYQHRKSLLMADKYIREHLAEELTLHKLAKLCNLDPTYFHKLYTAAFGKTPAQRILGFRIAAAKTGLLERKVTLGELAGKCGFSSQTYFCYKFKQVTGMTPLQYRSHMLNHSKN